MKPYGLISDTHHHNWTAFSTVNAKGINTRLQTILDETVRCAVEVGKAGGDTIIHAGDLFHVRGSVAPSVLNPTLATYKKLIEMGFKIIINAGNHDLEGRDANEIGSAITALKEVGCQVINSPVILGRQFALVPYIGKVDELKKVLEKLQDETDAPNCDLIIHAGIDGVIKGLPDHGLSAEYLARLKFARVFAGHYHHHKELYPRRVWSIGATTHQTWGDIGTKAGFCVVYDGQVRFSASHAPNFVEIDGTTDPDDIPLIVDGNYVRAKIYSSKSKEIEELRSFLMTSGALGVTIISQPATGVTRTASTVKAGASLETSVSDFIKAGSFGRSKELATVCDDILKQAREATA